MSRLKKGLVGVGAALAVAAIGAFGFATAQAHAFDTAMATTYDVPLPQVTRSTDPAVLARGKHLVESITACATADCHGADLGGGKTLAMGPLGTLTGPNITSAGALERYSDAELVRLIRHGVKRDGRSVRLMPAQEFGWISLDDASAIASYLRTVPPVTRADGPVEVGLLGKVLDRGDKVQFDVARRIDHAARDKETAPKPEPTAAYGAYIARGCTGCHGEHLSGGPIPGAPSSMAVPKNITPHESGLAAWSFEDFQRMCASGESRGGRKLDPLMPVQALGKMDAIEMRALWEHLRSVPPRPFGQR